MIEFLPTGTKIDVLIIDFDPDDNGFIFCFEDCVNFKGVDSKHNIVDGRKSFYGNLFKLLCFIPDWENLTSVEQ